MANVKNSDLKVPPLKIVLSSATSGGSDRSSSTSPSSESESLDSNLTIISEKEHHEKSINKSDLKDDIVQGKQDKVSRHTSRVSCDEKSLSNNSIVNKKSHDNNGPTESNNCDATATREHTSTSSQRITRSSQRAAQQNKSENLNETNGDELNATEVQDKTIESARKVKRRKGEQPDNEQDSNQQVPPQPIVMAEICPADYQLPSQNSFELYRDIRKRPYKKLMQLTHVQPKVPQGFKDYLLNSGPYLLDGNRIGVGLRGGSSVENTETSNQRTSLPTNGFPPKMKFTNLRYKLTQVQSQKYTFLKTLDAPKVLKTGSPLYELFQDQEKSRQRMRMQHLKERERSILTAEQEILRAYNKAAIIDSKQELNLSACTYFYYQERYHYIDERNDSIDCVNPKDLVSVEVSSKSDANAADIPSADQTASTSDTNIEKIELDTKNLDKESSKEAIPKVDMSEADLRILNKTAFLENLQEIDDKWSKIKSEMMTRHKNESDSLFAVQSLEWEWKAKEIGACDVRVSLKIDPDFVPRVDISSIDY